MLWMSPEICGHKTGNSSPYTEASDVWAYGVVLYEMFSKKTPYEITNKKTGEKRLPNMYAFMFKVGKGRLRPDPEDLENLYSTFKNVVKQDSRMP